MSKPAIFSDLPLEEARAQASASQKLLLIDVGAEWCAPCKNMDKTTWVDPSVVEWVAQNAIAVQLDGDTHRPLIEPFGIAAFPTMILEREGKELARTTGGRSATAMLRWLQTANARKKELDVLLENKEPSNHERLDRAEMLARAGRDEEALNEFVWLWEHALERDAAWVGVRNSFLPRAMERLLKRYAPARERVRRLCATAAERRNERDGFRDWLTLSLALDDTIELLSWLRDLDATAAAQLDLQSQRRLLEIIAEKNEWALLGRLLGDASALWKEEHARIQQVFVNVPDWVTPQEIADTRVGLTELLQARAANMRRALLAANRVADADALKTTALEFDGSNEMRAALEK